VRSEDCSEYELFMALTNFGHKLKKIYLRGLFETGSLSNLNNQCPALVHLEIDWTECFLPFPPCSKVETIVFHNTAWLMHVLKPAFLGQLLKIVSENTKWSALHTIQDMSVSCTTFRGRKVRWWDSAVLQATVCVGINVIDREGRNLRQGDIVQPDGTDYPAYVN